MRYDVAVAIIKRHLYNYVEPIFRILKIKVKYEDTKERQCEIDMKKDSSTIQHLHLNDNPKIK